MNVFLLLLNTKEDILKNVSNQTLTSIVGEKKKLWNNRVLSTVCLPTFFKIYFLVFSRRKKLIQV